MFYNCLKYYISFKDGIYWTSMRFAIACPYFLSRAGSHGWDLTWKKKIYLTLVTMAVLQGGPLVPWWSCQSLADMS